MGAIELVLYYFLICAVVIAVAATAFVGFQRLRTRREARRTAAGVFTVWAKQGPFESGAQSALAMRNSYAAVCGEEELEKYSEGILAHEQSFDLNPEEWERNRLTIIEHGNPDAIALGERVFQTEKLNEVMPDTGTLLKTVRTPDGDTVTRLKQIWSDEKIEEHRKETGEVIATGIGNGLLNNKSPEGEKLVEFLSTVHRDFKHEEADACALGAAWLNLSNFHADHPDNYLAAKFQELKEAVHKADIENNGEEGSEPKEQAQKIEPEGSEPKEQEPEPEPYDYDNLPNPYDPETSEEDFQKFVNNQVAREKWRYNQIGSVLNDKPDHVRWEKRERDMRKECRLKREMIKKI